MYLNVNPLINAVAESACKMLTKTETQRHGFLGYLGSIKVKQI